MFVIRNVFVAKPGCAGKLAAQLKDAVAAFAMPGARVLTDVTGDFNRVIMEYTVESMAEFETRMKEVMSSPMYRERMAGYAELWTAGSREVLRVH
ncbi:MAG: hypothetical protein R2762_04130 [Bryobacteraceae bacterium]